MAEIEFKCKRCKRIFSYYVGGVSFPPEIYAGGRPKFEREIYCPRCGLLSLDEVELTEGGQTQLSELYFREMERKC